MDEEYNPDEEMLELGSYAGDIARNLHQKDISRKLDRVSRELAAQREEQRQLREREAKWVPCPVCGGPQHGIYRKCRHCQADLIWMSTGIGEGEKEVFFCAEKGHEEELLADVKKYQKEHAEILAEKRRKKKELEESRERTKQIHEQKRIEVQTRIRRWMWGFFYITFFIVIAMFTIVILRLRS